MEILWICISVIGIFGTGILSVRLWCYRKQIDHMRKEVELLQESDTNFKLTSLVAVGKTDELIRDINAVLTKNREEERRLVRENRIYRESITSISHDIRTPLTSAKGYLQMLQKPGVPREKQSSYLRTVEMRLDNLTDMLNQLFEYTRIEAGEMELAMEEIYPVNLFAETLSMFYGEFQEKKCEPGVELTDEPIKIRADRHAFVRIGENLIRNALVHGTGGYVFRLERQGEKMHLCVSNLTDSIEYGDVDRIFDRFYTADTSRSRKTTGLGLAIVKRFAEQMGGRVGASLVEGRFTVEVWFPLVVSDET